MSSVHLPGPIREATPVPARVTLGAARRAFEREFVLAAIARADGNRREAARTLGVSRQGLAKLMSRLDIGPEVPAGRGTPGRLVVGRFGGASEAGSRMQTNTR